MQRIVNVHNVHPFLDTPHISKKNLCSRAPRLYLGYDPLWNDGWSQRVWNDAHPLIYSLINEHSYWTCPFIVSCPIRMVIFHSYVMSCCVKLPEGNSLTGHIPLFLQRPLSNSHRPSGPETLRIFQLSNVKARLLGDDVIGLYPHIGDSTMLDHKCEKL